MVTKYYFAFNVYADPIAAGAEFNRIYSNLLREIFPDKAFRLKRISLICRANTNPGDEVEFGVFRNVESYKAGTEEYALTAGVIWFRVFTKVQADGQDESWNADIEFPEGIEFDKDDSLNIRCRALNSAAADRRAEWLWILEVEV